MIVAGVAPRRGVGPRASGGRGSGRTNVLGVLLRLYVGVGGPVIAIVLFLWLKSPWWALGSMLPWFLVARVVRGRVA